MVLIPLRGSISCSDSDLKTSRRMGDFLSILGVPEVTDLGGKDEPGEGQARAHTHMAVFPSEQKALPLAELEGPIPIPSQGSSASLRGGQPLRSVSRRPQLTPTQLTFSQNSSPTSRGVLGVQPRPWRLASHVGME